MRFKSAILQVTVIAVAAAVGVVVLVASAGGQAGGNLVVVPTPTRTIEETSALSDRLNAEDAAADKAIADDLVESGRSVKDFQRSGTTVLHNEPLLDVDAALSEASAVVVGVVRDQFLTRGSDTRFKLERTYVVSLVETTDGETVQVAQPVGIFRAAAGVMLLGNGLLEPGSRYAVLVTAPSSTSVPDAIRGHVYRLNADGSIVDDPATTEGLRTAADLVARFNAAKGAVSGQ